MEGLVGGAAGRDGGAVGRHPVEGGAHPGEVALGAPQGRQLRRRGLDDPAQLEQVADEGLARLGREGPGQDVGIEEVSAAPRAHPRAGLGPALHQPLALSVRVASR